MSEKPILFNTEMVRLILDGRKTQTRRLCKGQPQDGMTSPEKMGYEPPYRSGDVLWVRETWNCLELGQRGKEKRSYWYRADEDEAGLNPDDKWRPSIHMPREAARIFLRVKNVRGERLQEISGEDCVAEGCNADMLSVIGAEFTRGVFNGIWDSTIKKADLPRYGWDANPWVWAISFERIIEQEGRQ